MSLASAQQITAIRTLASRAGMDDDTYRDFLEREAGVRSTKRLSFTTAGRVIDRLRTVTGQATWAKGTVAGLDSAVAKKLQALWITGYNLGLVRDRSDQAMLSFLQRQTGVSHTRFLEHPSEAAAAIEALKSWLRRDAGVEWPFEAKRGDADIIDIKLAVIEAQWRKLGELGATGRLNLEGYATRAAGRRAWDEFESAHYDEVQRSLGRRIRARLASGCNDSSERAV